MSNSAILKREFFSSTTNDEDTINYHEDTDNNNTKEGHHALSNEDDFNTHNGDDSYTTPRKEETTISSMENASDKNEEKLSTNPREEYETTTPDVRLDIKNTLKTKTIEQVLLTSIISWTCTKNKEENVEFVLENFGQLSGPRIDEFERNFLMFSANKNIYSYLIGQETSVDAFDLNGWKSIHYAAREDNIEIVKYIMENFDMDDNDKDLHGMTPLMWSTWRDDTRMEVMKYLVEKRKVNLDVYDNNGYTALYWASKFNNQKAFQYLINKNATLADDIKCISKCFMMADYLEHVDNIREIRNKMDYITNINIAVEHGNIHILKQLELRNPTYLGNLLILATINNHTDVANYLIDKINYNYFQSVKKLTSNDIMPLSPIATLDQSNKTSLNYAAENKNTILFHKLSNNYKDVLLNLSKKFLPLQTQMVITAIQKNQLIDEYINENPVSTMNLFDAIQDGRVKDIENILDTSEILLDHKDEDGKTPLMVAIEKISPPDHNVLKRLIKNVNIKDNNGKTALMIAVEKEDIPTIEILFKNPNLKLDAQDIDRKSALMYSVEKRNIKIVRLLIEHRTNLFLKDKNGNHVWMIAAEVGDPDIFEILMELAGELDINERNANGETLWMIAAKNGHVEIINILIRQWDIAFDEIDNQNRTALMLAVENNHNNATMVLLNHTDDIDTKYNDGKTSLMLSSQNGNVKVVKELLKKGSDTNEVDGHGRTALMLAIISGHVEIVKILMKEKPEVDQKDNNGLTSLMFAAQTANSNPIIKILLDNNADVNLKDNSGKTPLIYAVNSRDIRIVRQIIEGKPNIDEKEKDGKTALMFASQNSYPIAQLLIENKANVNLQDKYGQTPLIFAVKYIQRRTVKLLVNKNAKINEGDIEGKTALMYATERDLPITKMLVKNDADVNLRDNFGKNSLTYSVQGGLIDIYNFLIFKNAQILKTYNGQNLLMSACEYNRFHFVKKFAEEFDVNEMDKDGYTALIWAVSYHHDNRLAIVKYLIENCNADWDVVDLKYKQNVFHWATWAGNLNILKYLNEKNNNKEINNENTKNLYDVRNYEGKTSIFLAIQQGRYDSFKYLLDKTDIDIVDNNGKTLLIIACECGHKNFIKELVRKGPELINNKDKQDRTALFYTCYIGNLEIVRYLVENNAEVNVVDKDGENMFMAACNSGQKTLMKYIKDKTIDFDVNYVTKDGITALISAISSRNLEAFEYLSEELGADINHRCIKEKNILLWASELGSLEIVKYLIKEKNFDVDSVDNDGYSALVWATSTNQYEVVEYLVGQNASLELRDKYQQTVIYWCCYARNIKILRFLVDNNVNLDVIDKEERSPLHLAANYGALEIVKYFIEEKNFTNLLDQNGRTPVHYAARNGHLDILKYFRTTTQNIFSLDAEDAHKKTPLIFATENNHISVAKYLIDDNNVDPNHFDASGQNSLIYASKLGYQDLVTYLVEKTNSLNNPNDNKTALFYAAEGGHNDIIKTLLNSNKFDVNFQDSYNNTPLLLAVDANQNETAKFLILNYPETNISLQNSDGNNAIHLASQKRNTNLVNLLIERVDCTNIPTNLNPDIKKQIDTKCQQRRLRRHLVMQLPEVVSLPTLPQLISGPTVKLNIDDCVCNNMALVLLFQDLLDKKYPLPTFQKYSHAQLKAIALNFTEVSEKILKDLKLNVEIDSYDFYLEILDAVKNEKYSKIINILGKYLGDDCSGCEVFEKIVKYFKK